MRPHHIMFLSLCLLVGNLMCLIMDGIWFQAEDQSLMQYLTGLTALETASWTAIVTIPVGFLTHAFPKMVMWDYSFFSGQLQIIKWFLLALSIGAMWAMGQEFRITITSIFGRR